MYRLRLVEGSPSFFEANGKPSEMSISLDFVHVFRTLPPTVDNHQCIINLLFPACAEGASSAVTAMTNSIKQLHSMHSRRKSIRGRSRQQERQVSLRFGSGSMTLPRKVNCRKKRGNDVTGTTLNALLTAGPLLFTGRANPLPYLPKIRSARLTIKTVKPYARANVYLFQFFFFLSPPLPAHPQSRI